MTMRALRSWWRERLMIAGVLGRGGIYNCKGNGVIIERGGILRFPEPLVYDFLFLRLTIGSGRGSGTLKSAGGSIAG